MPNKIRVLIVDDSALVRQLLTAAFDATEDIQVVGTAIDSFAAREKIKQLQPDVITLDVEMPGMDGISFLSNLMRLRPMPVVMVSTMTTKGCAVTLNALELGAVDYVAKPDALLNGDLTGFIEEVQEKVRGAASAKVRPLDIRKKKISETNQLDFASQASVIKHFDHIVTIGASTGGTEAIKDVLLDLPVNAPSIVITQHIPANFSASFASRLDSLCAIRVVEAKHNQPVNPGTAYIAPGGQHLTVHRMNGHYVCKLDSSPPVNRHRPAVDVLFDSVNKHANGKAIGVLLTGMGSDGAAGLLRLKETGCYTIAQDETSSVVWGMPGSAVRLNAADDVLPLLKIAAQIMSLPIRKPVKPTVGK